MWRWVATTLAGDGTETAALHDLAFEGVSLVVPLSEWPTFEATLKPEQAVDLTQNSAIYSIYAGRVLAATIVNTLEESGSEVKVSANGFSFAPSGTPWTDPPQRLYQANSGDVFRSIWAHLQAQPGGNLGLQLTPFTTEAWVGRKVTQTDSDGNVTEIDEPFILSPTEDQDLAQKVSELVADGIEYRERHVLDGGQVRHVLDCGPRVGSDLTHLRFEVGENVTTPIAIETRAADAPTEVLLIGGGESPVYGIARSGVAGVRRVATVKDVTVTSNEVAAERAAARLATYRRRVTGYSLTVVDSEMVSLADFEVGDTIAVSGTRWGGAHFTGSGRITSITYDPSTGAADVDITPTT